MGEWVVALDPALREVVGAVGAEREGAVLGGAHEQPADVRVRAQRGHELGVTLVDLLEGEAAAFLHQVDEAEVAGAEHDDVAVGDVVLGPLLLPRRPRRLTDRVADHRALLVTAGDALDVAAGE